MLVHISYNWIAFLLRKLCDYNWLLKKDFRPNTYIRLVHNECVVASTPINSILITIPFAIKHDLVIFSIVAIFCPGMVFFYEEATPQ